MIRATAATLMSFAWFGVCSAAAPPPAVRAVQLAAAPSADEAESVVEAAQAAGFSPVWLREDGVYTRVLAGRCERLPDAILLKQSLRRHGFPDAFEKAFPGLAPGDFETEMTAPDPPMIYPPDTPPLRT